MSDSYKVRFLEVGVFTTTSWPSSPSAEDFSLVCVPGLPVAQVQFWRHEVQSDSGRREHLAIMAHHPEVTQDVCGAIAVLVRSIRPGAVISFARNLAVGYCELAVESHVEEGAAAIAEIQRAGGWDESEAFDVRVGSRAFDVTLQWTMKGTEARVCERAFAQSAASGEARTSSEASPVSER
jgi:hypothetical protein